MNNLTGQQFGQLTVLEKTDQRFHRSIVWHCRCSCGRDFDVPTMYLRSGAVTKCKECAKAQQEEKKKNQYAGKVYGGVELIRPTEQRKSGHVVWECKCSCGKIFYAPFTLILNGRIRSCGHLKGGPRISKNPEKVLPLKAYRICQKCGIPFFGEKEQRLCPNCRKNARADTVVRPRVCKQCGRTFQGGPRAFYCPKCREERNREANRKCKREGPQRPLGSTDKCVVCGKEYVVTSSRQKYCPECAKEATAAAARKRSREYATEHRAQYAQRKKELLDGRLSKCAYCGKSFRPNAGESWCSPECKKELIRISNGMSHYKAGRAANPPSFVRYSSGFPQSDVAGVSYNRARGKWQVYDKNKKYIGLYETKEEAENLALSLYGNS